MLKNEDLVRVVKHFEDRPIYVKLINQLWPHVKDFDFEKEKFLQMKTPKRVYHNYFERETGREEFYIHCGQLTQKYSHKVIRKVLEKWGLTASFYKINGGEEMMRIKKLQKKCK